MKTRSGFVSNSSSSSFIIRNTHNVLQIARRMIKVVNNGTNKRLEKFDKLIEDNKHAIQFDIPVTFISCNFDTYIYVLDTDVKVETCNNTDWTEATTGYLVTSRYEDENTKPDCYFWSLDYDILMKEIHYSNRPKMCNEHYQYEHFIFDDQTKMCPACYVNLKGHKTLTLLNNTPIPPYIGKNIRRYLSTKED